MGAGRAAFAALVLLCGGAEAQQLDFGRVSRTGDELLSYRWRDHDRREHAMAFTLTRQAIKEAETLFLEFSMDAMWRYLELDLRDEVEKFGNGAKINLSRSVDGLRWTISTRDQKQNDILGRRVSERLEREQKAYLAQHLRRRVDERRVMVDFAAAAQAMQGPMRAVARALGDIPGVANNDRARVDLALAFFQEIPYATLEDKKRHGGDFLPPPALLAQNRGDCDSKAVALAAVLRTYAPSRKMVMVTMPDHAILGVDLAAEPGEWTIKSQGRQYVALEAAGPAMAQIGLVGAHTAKYLGEGRGIEIWPLN
ncbi:MAG: hypothetical protein ACHQK9_02005 [Reyranellales bacterium]